MLAICPILSRGPAATRIGILDAKAISARKA